MNQKTQDLSHNYDIVIGPIANDKVGAQIRQKHEEGKSIAQLAEEFVLSTDSIRRILYR